MKIQEYKPLLVMVERQRWKAVPTYPVATPRDRMLLAELKAAGGVNNKTPPGLYHFNIVPGPLREIVVFTPAKLFA